MLSSQSPFIICHHRSNCLAKRHLFIFLSSDWRAPRRRVTSTTKGVCRNMTSQGSFVFVCHSWRFCGRRLDDEQACDASPRLMLLRSCSHIHALHRCGLASRCCGCNNSLVGWLLRCMVAHMNGCYNDRRLFCRLKRARRSAPVARASDRCVLYIFLFSLSFLRSCRSVMTALAGCLSRSCGCLVVAL